MFSQNDENRIDANEGETVALQLQRYNNFAGVINILWEVVPHQAGLQDYSPTNGNVSFSNNQQSATVLISLLGDSQVENIEVSLDFFFNGLLRKIEASEMLQFLIHHI